MDMTTHFTRLLVSHVQSRPRPERGAALVEYVMLVGLIAIVALIAVSTFGSRVSDMHTDIAETLISVNN